MKIELSRTDPLSGEADRLTLERATNRKDVRVRIENESHVGMTITVRKQDLIDAIKVF